MVLKEKLKILKQDIKNDKEVLWNVNHYLEEIKKKISLLEGDDESYQEKNGKNEKRHYWLSSIKSISAKKALHVKKLEVLGYNKDI